MTNVVPLKPDLLDGLGLRPVGSLAAAAAALYADGLQPGAPTPWPSVTELLTVAPGQLTVVTGWPGSGKSEWVDQLVLHLAMRQGWDALLYSPENWPLAVHVNKLVEKWVGKPSDARYPYRMTAAAHAEAVAAIGNRVTLIDSAAWGTDADKVMLLAGAHFQASTAAGRVFVIDPWNTMSHKRTGESETDYVGEFLEDVKGWAREHACHVVIVAHPAKQPRVDGKLQQVRPDMIAGSQHWWNKADLIVTVARSTEEGKLDMTDINVLKVRQKNIGKLGTATLRYAVDTGLFHDQPNHTDDDGRQYTYSYGKGK